MTEDTQVALVTGGSRGIGRAIAEQLATLNYAVGINYASNSQAAEAVLKEIEWQDGKGMILQGDVGSAKDRESMISKLMNKYGRIDVLVNNAGITSPGRPEVLDVTEEGWDKVFDTNLKGPFFLSQAAAKHMVKQESGGKIINVSSVSAYAVSTNRVDYCITKAGMGMMTQILATGLADHNIRVYEICPGVIASDMTAPVKEKYDKLIEEGMSPIRRWGKPTDIAKAVSALVQDYFPFSTGERFNIDGGFHIRRL